MAATLYYFERGRFLFISYTHVARVCYTRTSTSYNHINDTDAPFEQIKMVSQTIKVITFSCKGAYLCSCLDQIALWGPR